MLVSIGIVALNEEEYLPNLLQNLIEQDYPHEKIEIILIDSNSTDMTPKIMMNFANKQKSFFRIEVIKNYKKNQASGWNCFLKDAEGEAFIRIDAHSKIPRNFISKNILALEKNEYVVGGSRPNIIKNQNDSWKNVLLLAENSMFGSGISDFRNSKKQKYVKSLFHAMYRRSVFEKVGNFNENLGRTEDNDIHYKIRKAGFKLFYNPDIISYQYTRPSLKKMLRQKFLNGYWIGITVGVQPKCLNWYYFVPFLFLCTLVFCAIITSKTIYPFIGLILLYGTVDLMMTLLATKNKPFHLFQCVLPVLFLLLHISYGSGTLSGFVKLPCWYLKKKESV